MYQKMIDLYDEYHCGLMDRREFLRRLSVLTGGMVAAHTLLSLLESKDAKAEVISKDDPRLQTGNIKYPGATGEVRAYFTRPKGDHKLPGVVVIPEIYGLVPHIEDVARRVALEGFVAMAPDPLTPLGGTPEDPNKARSLTQNLDSQSTIQNFVAAVKYLKTYPTSTGKVGVIGFCWGGGMANQLAVNSPDLSAAVPYYGIQPGSEDVSKIKASLLLHYAGVDERINKGISAYEEALKRVSIDYKLS